MCAVNRPHTYCTDKEGIWLRGELWLDKLIMILLSLLKGSKPGGLMRGLCDRSQANFA
jgi:hypothetical protein